MANNLRGLDANQVLRSVYDTSTNSLRTTDANGRVTVNLTTTGLVGGPALFSSLVKYNAIGFDASGNALQVPLFFVESASATQVVFRGVKGRSQGILLGGTVIPIEFLGAGYTVNVQLIGIKA